MRPQEEGEPWSGLPVMLGVMWAGSQRQHLNVSVIVSDAAGPVFCPWFTAMLRDPLRS